MKKILVLALMFITAIGVAQKPPQSPTVSSESSNVKIIYGQPSKRGREIFGKLVPYNEVWRTGANAATEVTFKKDVNFGGKDLKAGTYSLFTIPTATEWTVILNSELKQWGSYGYDKIKSHNVVEVKVKPVILSEPQEKLNILADNSQISISWDKTSVVVPIK